MQKIFFSKRPLLPVSPNLTLLVLPGIRYTLFIENATSYSVLYSNFCQYPISFEETGYILISWIFSQFHILPYFHFYLLFHVWFIWHMSFLDKMKA